MNRIDFMFNNYFRGNYKSFEAIPNFTVVWDMQWAKEYRIKECPPHYSLELWVTWLFWGVGIEIRFFIKKKKKVTGSGTANKISKFKS